MKNRSMLSVLFVAAAGFAYGDPVQEFSDADTNQDGKLSADEARLALPDVTIEDMNHDGQLSVSEAQHAFPALEQLADRNPEAPIGASEYRLMVQAIESAMSGNS